MAGAGPQHTERSDTLRGRGRGPWVQARPRPGTGGPGAALLSVVISGRCYPVLAAARRMWPCLFRAARLALHMPLRRVPVLLGSPGGGLHRGHARQFSVTAIDDAL